MGRLDMFNRSLQMGAYRVGRSRFYKEITYLGWMLFACIVAGSNPGRE
jgi:hypothetical protein